jgi:hypothetical protein
VAAAIAVSAYRLPVAGTKGCENLDDLSLSLPRKIRELQCRFTPQSDRLLHRREMTLCAISDQSALQQKESYSITSSARARTVAGH